MTTSLVVQIGRELMLTAMLLVMPTVVVSLVIGLVISIFQTITSIQEQTLTFAPRIVAVGIVFILTLPWSLRILMSFTYRMLQQAAETVN